MSFHASIRWIVILLAAVALAPSAAGQYGDDPIEVTDLLKLRQIEDVDVAPDGRQVVYTVRSIVRDEDDDGRDSLVYRTHLFLADAAGSASPRQLTRGERSASSPAWHPDSDRLAFIRTIDDKPQVFVLPLLGGEAYQVTSFEHGASAPQWSPDGGRLLVTSRIPESALRERLGQPPPWPLERPGLAWSNLRSDVEPSPDGSITQVRAWLERNARDGDPRVLHRLTFQGEHDLEPEPSYRQLFVVEVDTTTEPTMISRGYSDYQAAAWLGDGERIVAAGRTYGDIHPDRTRESRLYLISAGGGAPRLLLDMAPYALSSPAVSPDGQNVAFTARDTSDQGYGQTEIGVFPLDRPQEARLLTADFDRSASAPVWSADGWYVYFTAPSNGGVPLYRLQPFETPAPEPADDAILAQALEDAEALDALTGGAEGDDELPEEAEDNAFGDADAEEAGMQTAEEGPAPDTTESGPGVAIERLTSFERGIRSFDIGRATLFFAATEVANPYELYAANLSVTQERRVTDYNAGWLADKRLSFPERRTLERDTLEIEYWVMRPAFFEEEETYPLLLQIHGGPMAMWGPGEFSMWHELQYFAARGYGIVFSNPRGSGGYGDAFERANFRDWGAGPAADVLAAADAAAALPWADSTRQFITGGSYAGYLTAWIVAHDDRFRAAATQRGVYDLNTFLGEGNAWRLVPAHFGGFPWDRAVDAEPEAAGVVAEAAAPPDVPPFESGDEMPESADEMPESAEETPEGAADTTDVAEEAPADAAEATDLIAEAPDDAEDADTIRLSAAEILIRNSPLTYVDRIRTPLLILHADHDLRTGVAQSEMLYRSLKILGRPVEYVRYPDAGHNLSRTGAPLQRMDRLLRLYEFFERFRH